jgi:hypothetical protein
MNEYCNTIAWRTCLLFKYGEVALCGGAEVCLDDIGHRRAAQSRWPAWSASLGSIANLIAKRSIQMFFPSYCCLSKGTGAFTVTRAWQQRIVSLCEH